jgi:hypothetical protein
MSTHHFPFPEELQKIHSFTPLTSTSMNVLRTFVSHMRPILNFKGLFGVAAIGLAIVLLIFIIRAYFDTKQETVGISFSAKVVRGFPTVAFYTFIFSASFSLFNSVLSDCCWFQHRNFGWRTFLRVCLFCGLFAFITMVPFVRNRLSRLLGWLTKLG